MTVCRSDAPICLRQHGRAADRRGRCLDRFVRQRGINLVVGDGRIVRRQAKTADRPAFQEEFKDAALRRGLPVQPDDLGAIDLPGARAEGFHRFLRGDHGARFSLRAWPPQAVGLRPGGQRRAPQHAALVAPHHAAGQGHDGMLFRLQGLIE